MRLPIHRLAAALLIWSSFTIISPAQESPNTSHALTANQVPELKSYIHSAWKTLSR